MSAVHVWEVVNARAGEPLPPTDTIDLDGAMCALHPHRGSAVRVACGLIYAPATAGTLWGVLACADDLDQAQVLGWTVARPAPDQPGPTWWAVALPAPVGSP